MATPLAIQEFLRLANIGYYTFQHAPAFTAMEEAAITHTPGRDWAKVVTCFAGEEPVQAVVPATSSVDLERLRELAGVRTIRLAHEEELQWLYPDCERGAMPPFGPLYKQRVFVDRALSHEFEIVFNGGTHTDAIRMRYSDFLDIARPLVGSFGGRLAH